MRGKVIEMRKTKFWLFQIVMLVMLSLLFGSPVFAGPPDNTKGKGVEMSRLALSNHAGGHSKGMENANENAAFYEEASDPVDPPEEEEDDSECTESGQWIFHDDGTVTICP